MYAWQAWQAYVRVIVNDPTYSDTAAQSSEAALAQSEQDAYQAIADVANTEVAAASGGFGISDQAKLNFGISTESGTGTADFTFSVSGGVITGVYIDNLVVAENAQAPSLQ